MSFNIIEDNETLFKYSIEDFKFTHFNTTNEDGTTNDGRKLSEEEKAEKVNESIKYIENLKATESTFKNIIDETEKKKEKKDVKNKWVFVGSEEARKKHEAMKKKDKKHNDKIKAFLEYYKNKPDTDSD